MVWPFWYVFLDNLACRLMLIYFKGLFVGVLVTYAGFVVYAIYVIRPKFANGPESTSYTQT